MEHWPPDPCAVVGRLLESACKSVRRKKMDFNNERSLSPRFELQFTEEKLEDIRFYCCDLHGCESMNSAQQAGKAFAIMLLQYKSMPEAAECRFVSYWSARKSPGRTLANALLLETSVLKDVLQCGDKDLTEVI